MSTSSLESVRGGRRGLAGILFALPLALLLTAARPGVGAAQATDDATIRRVSDRTAALSLMASSDMNEWDWEAGVAIAGMMEAYAVTGDRRILDDVAAWTETRIAEGVTLTHINHATPGWGVLMLYEARPDPRYLALVERCLRFLLDRAPRVHGTLAHWDDQLWDDTLITSVPLLARYGARHGCAECLAAAVDEVLAHGRRLQDPASGRWYHGWDASDFRAGAFPHMSGAFWARGNGWAALATAELLRFLPQDHPDRPALVRALDRQLRGLAELQAPSGLWHTVVDRPDFYLEASGSAAIAAAMLRGARAGWLDIAFLGPATRGAAAVRGHVAADGTLTQVSDGTGVAPTIPYYNTIPTLSIQPYGQGLFLLMAAAERGG